MHCVGLHSISQENQRREVVHLDQRFHPFLKHNEQIKQFQEATRVKVCVLSWRARNVRCAQLTFSFVLGAALQVFFGDTDEVAVQGNKADVDRLLALLEEVYTEKVRADWSARVNPICPLFWE